MSAALMVAVLALVLTGASVAGSHGVSGPAVRTNGVRAAGLNASYTYLWNVTPPGSSPVTEWVYLNNATAPVELPQKLVVTTNTYVNIANLTQHPKGVDSAGLADATVQWFSESHTNLTAAQQTADQNPSVLNVTHTFTVAKDTSTGLNFVWTNYSVEQFSSPELKAPACTGAPAIAGSTCLPADAQAFGEAVLVYSQNTTGARTYSNTTSPFNATHAFAVSIEVGFSAQITLSTFVSVAGACSTTGCPNATYSFSSALDASGSNTSAVAVFTFSHVHQGYDNWTAYYTSASHNNPTSFGFFVADTQSFVQVVFFDFWYVWLVLLILLGMGLYFRSTKRRRN